MLRKYVDEIGAYTSDETEAKDIKDFLSKRSNSREDIKMAISQCIERLEANVAFVKYNNPVSNH